MAKRRMLSRRISYSKRVNALSLKAQLVYTWLIPFLDDYGCYHADAEDIKTIIFPKNKKISTKNIEAALSEMQSSPLIYLYNSNGKPYLQYLNFTDFQTFRADRKRVSEYPQYNAKNGDCHTIDIPMATNDGYKLSKVKLSKDKIKEYCRNSDEFRLASLLLIEILKRKPDYKKPDLQSWAKHVDLMIRRDNRKPDRIEEIIKFCQQDCFWQNNILSTVKLRKHFDRLEMLKNGRENVSKQGEPGKGKAQKTNRSDGSKASQQKPTGSYIR